MTFLGPTAGIGVPDEYLVLFGLVLSLVLTMVSLVSEAAIIMTALGVLVIQYVTGSTLSAYVLGYNVLALDLVFCSAFAAGAIRFAMRGRYYRVEALFAVIVLYTLASFLIGLSKFGLTAAVTFFRATFYVLGGMLLSLSFADEIRRIDRLGRFWIMAAGVLAVAAVAGQIFPDAVQTIEQIGGSRQYRHDDSRILPASAAMVIAQAALILHLSSGQPATLAQRTVASVALLIAVIVLYHRSVWIASIGALAIVLMHDPRSVVKVSLAIGGLMFGVLLVWILTAAAGTDLIADKLVDASVEPFDTDSSLAWRVVGWKALVARSLSSGPVTMMLGSGFGTGYERLVATGVIAVSPHNFFVEVLVNSGVIGVALWVTLFAWVGMRLFRRESGGALLNATTGLALLISVFVFSFSYSPGPEQGLLLGAVVGMSLRGAMPARMERVALSSRA